DWLPATNEQFADYTGLKEGAYTFEVRSVMGDQTSAPARFSFSVATPFWKTWWFFAALTVLAISGVYAVIAWRTYRLRRAKKQLEYEVALRTEKIRKQNEELEHFTYIVSHDLKTPVFNIGGLIEMLQATNLPPDQHRDEIFDMMHESTNHLKHNLERLMEVIKARDSGNEPTQTIRFDKLIREVTANTHILIRDAGAKVHLDLKVAEITYNRSNLYSLLYNLLTNAIKYRAPERTPEVHIRTWKADGFIGLSLADNGLGIDLERDGEKLFGMFQRIHQQGEGTGIGLHLVKTMIENSGGHLTVESEVGKGTTFHAALVPEGKD
ncbi:MAG: HAMP domain-containing sensor histidine kinase, partial [Bacteroidota bacterium]